MGAPTVDYSRVKAAGEHVGHLTILGTLILGYQYTQDSTDTSPRQYSEDRTVARHTTAFLLTAKEKHHLSECNPSPSQGDSAGKEWVTEFSSPLQGRSDTRVVDREQFRKKGQTSRVLPFGLCNAPATFQRVMNTVLAGLIYKCCAVYLDDIVIASPTFEQHLLDLREVFLRLEKAGLTLKPGKCQFCRKELKFLGYKVLPDGILPDSDKIDAVLKFPVPTDVKQICRYSEPWSSISVVAELVDKEQLRGLQREDPVVTEILRKLEDPQGTRSVEEWEDKFVTCDGLVYYRDTEHSCSLHPLSDLKMFVPESPRGLLLKYYHDHPTAGHLGFTNSLARLKMRFFWPKMRKDVKSYVLSCPVCQLTKPSQLKPAGMLVPVSQPETPENTVQRIHDHAHASLKSSHVRQKRHYDKTRCSIVYEPGDLVRLKSHPRSDAVANLTAKLAPVFSGLYKVVKKLFDVNYRLSGVDGTDMGVVHVVNLQPFRARSTPYTESHSYLTSGTADSQDSSSSRVVDSLSPASCEKPEFEIGEQVAVEGTHVSDKPVYSNSSQITLSQPLADMFVKERDMPLTHSYDLRSRVGRSDMLDTHTTLRLGHDINSATDDLSQ
ncbi:hypothetical protein NFI96_021587, partial [Prochilodus magdalenae]